MLETLKKLDDCLYKFKHDAISKDASTAVKYAIYEAEMAIENLIRIVESEK